MKIALIRVTPGVTYDGSWLISALLRRAGHHVRTVLFTKQAYKGVRPYSIEPLKDILKDVDLLMIGVYSVHAYRAVQITEFVHKNYDGLKVIWGGPHCVSAPELSLRHADGVCFSEGDEAVVEMVEKMERGLDYTDTPNMAFNINGTHKINRVLPPFSALDTLPYPDYTLKDYFVFDGELRELTKELYRKNAVAGYPFKRPTFWLLTSRGCPHVCSYCNNCRYVKMFNHNPMRYHSVDYIIGWLEYGLKNLDFFENVGFGDDDFFMRPKNQLEDFAEKYKKRIGLPFSIAFSANTYRREKLEILLDAGLTLVQMGIQSASQRVLDEVFNRRVKVSKTKEVIYNLRPYLKTYNLQIRVDFITDNPYESPDDIIETYLYFLELPRGCKINLFLLSFLPGTPIYERALKDGFIEPDEGKRWRHFMRSIRYQNNYETFLLFFYKFLHQHPFLKYIPRGMLRILATKPVRAVASKFPRRLYIKLITFIRKL